VAIDVSLMELPNSVRSGNSTATASASACRGSTKTSKSRACWRLDVPVPRQTGSTTSKRSPLQHALVVRAAIEGGAATLYSEDLQHGQVFEMLGVENPMR
jgi:hypothetical protein